MVSEILSAVAAANLASGVAVLAVLALRRLVRSRFGARAAYALWVAPLLAAVAVLAPQPARETALAPIVLSLTEAATGALPAAVTAPASPVPAMLLGVWLAGALAAAALLARRQASYLRSLGRLAPLSPDEPGVLRAERSGIGPAVVGALHPRIVTPADFEARFAADERRLILAHERAHLATGDAAVNALATALQCLGWCNPLVHIAARLMRVDQEFACDAAVVGRFPEARRVYAELLLKTQLVTQPLPIGCHWPARSQHPLKERIAMLKSPLPEPAMRAMGLIVAACLGVAAGSAAWAAAPAHDEVESRVTVSEPVAAGKPADVRVERRTVTDAKLTQIAEAQRDVRRTRLTTSDAEGGGRPAPLIVQPEWAIKPTAADLADVYPPEAIKAGLGGAATIACGVSADGRLADCQVVSEAPAQAGFGEAALKLSERFQMKPMSRDGHPVSGGKVRIPIRFMLPRPPQSVTPS